MATSTTSSPDQAHAEAPTRLPLPERTSRRKILWAYLLSVALIHVLALAALAPWLFSWFGLALALGGIYVFGTLGINTCYHRLLTHRGFECPLWLEHALAVIGVCCLQETPIRWVAIHRMHHQHSDTQPDPHSPLVDFFWSHCGWLFADNPCLSQLALYDRYARDLVKDRFYVRIERRKGWIWINLAQWGVFYVLGMLVGLATSGTLAGGVQLGLSAVVWGVFVRTVAVWHITWSVNSLTHLWGYRNYETDENSRNNWFVGIVANGEGWHNNHHADPRSAKHGHKWWEFDVTYITIDILRRLGLAWNVLPPRVGGRKDFEPA
ncbi:MAG TPA: acyl-CoA desaturase [Pirellulales bacterium]